MRDQDDVLGSYSPCSGTTRCYVLMPLSGEGSEEEDGSGEPAFACACWTSVRSYVDARSNWSEATMSSRAAWSAAVDVGPTLLVAMKV